MFCCNTEFEDRIQLMQTYAETSSLEYGVEIM